MKPICSSPFYGMTLPLRQAFRDGHHAGGGGRAEHREQELRIADDPEGHAGQLTEAGIRTTVRLFEWGVHTKRIFSHQTDPLILYGWADSKGDPESHNRFVIKSGGSWSQFRDAKLDALINAIDVEMDRDKRKQLILDLQHYQREIWPVSRPTNR